MGLGHAGKEKHRYLCIFFQNYANQRSTRNRSRSQRLDIKWKFNEITPYGRLVIRPKERGKREKMFNVLVDYIVKSIQK
jgi:vacuolar-type H+-ATPase subunit B/Vma2